MGSTKTTLRPTISEADPPHPCQRKLYCVHIWREFITAKIRCPAKTIRDKQETYFDGKVFISSGLSWFQKRALKFKCVLQLCCDDLDQTCLINATRERENRDDGLSSHNSFGSHDWFWSWPTSFIKLGSYWLSTRRKRQKPCIQRERVLNWVSWALDFSCLDIRPSTGIMQARSP